jgi:hypothetical protein
MEGGMKFRAVESVLCRVRQQMSKNRIRVKGRVDFLKIETTPLSEHAGYFLNPQVPLLQVMDDSEIKHRVDTRIPVGEMLGIGEEEARSFENGAGGFAKSKLNHGRVDIYGVHAFGMKILTHESGAVPPSTADFKAVTPLGHRPDPFEVPGFHVLNKPSHGAVYPHPFGPIDFHWVIGTPFPSIAGCAAGLLVLRGSMSSLSASAFTPQSKDPDPEGPALMISRGDFVYLHLTMYGVLEYWSGGVMEETPFFIALRKQIPGENPNV